MPFDPQNRKDLEKLQRAVSYSRKKMEPFVKNRQMILDELAGPVHVKRTMSPSKRMPRNKMDQMVTTLVNALVDEYPVTRVTNVGNPRLAQSYKAMLDRAARESRLVDTLQDAVQDAVLRMGVVKVGTWSPNPADKEDDLHDPGMPYADAVGLDSFVIDMRPESLHLIDFAGNTYARRLEYLKNSPYYDQDVVRKLTPNMTPGIKKDIYQSPLHDWVDLIDIWLPLQRVIITMADDPNGPIELLRPPVPYDGPEQGPYHFLSFKRVRGQVMPASLADILFDSHDFVTRGYRRIYRQADRQAEFYTYTGEAEEDAERFKRAYDGEFVRVDTPNGVQRQIKGGVNPQTIAVAIHADQTFDNDAGNLKMLQGVSTGASTLGEARILAQNLSASVKMMRNRVYDFTAGILRHWAWYIWTDPMRQEKVTRTTTNGFVVQDQWSPEIVEGDFLDNEIDIEPGSLQSRSNEQQLLALVESARLIREMMQLPASRPMTFDHAYFTELLATLGNQPELTGLIKFAADIKDVVPGVPTQGQEGGGMGAPQASPPQADKLMERMIFSGGQQLQP